MMLALLVIHATLLAHPMALHCMVNCMVNCMMYTSVYFLSGICAGVAKEAHDPMDMEENYLFQQMITELSSKFPEIYSE